MNDPHNAGGVGNCCAVNGLGNSPAHTQSAPQEFVPDHLAETLLETAIEVARQRLCEAPTREGKLEAWREMCGLIDQRTPSRRRFMARMAGLE